LVRVIIINTYNYSSAVK